MSLSNEAKLAMKFSEILRDDLTEEQMDLVNERNAAEPRDSPRVCHSHDFCDANEVMADALELMGVPEFRPEVSELVNAAWNLARESEFDAEKIAEDEKYFDVMTGESDRIELPPPAAQPFCVVQQRRHGPLVAVFGPFAIAASAAGFRDRAQQTDPTLAYTLIQIEEPHQ